jgi:hypothetical protein
LIQRDGLPISLSDQKRIFREWRVLNWIDDLMLEILEQVIDLKTTLEHHQLPSLTWMDRVLNERRFRALRVDPEALKIALDPVLKAETPTLDLSLVEEWPKIASELSSLSGGSDRISVLTTYAYLHGVLNDSQYKLVDAFRVHQVERWSLRLAPYLRMLETIKNSNRTRSPSEQDLEPNAFSSQRIFKRSSLTRRKSLYIRFSSLQVQLLVSLMKKFFHRMEADQAALVFSGESIPLSPMGQYHFARKLLLKDLKDLNRSFIFQSSPFTFEDLITASLESGLIHGGILDQVFQIDDLWNPSVHPWRKVTAFALQVTGNASVFLPAPYNVISSVALVLIEGQLHRKKRKTLPDPSGYDPF